jgi:CubicO group peptidase (beta-lactamase class C family)
MMILPTCLASTLSAQGLPTARPESVGMSADRLQQLTATMQAEVDQKQAAGIVTMIAHRGRVVYMSAVGSRDLAAGAPMSSDSLFRLASMTKPVTSVAIMMLYEQGRIKLSDPISKYIPEFKATKVLAGVATDPSGKRALKLEPMRREITIEDLLCHRSGLTYGFMPSAVADAYKQAGVLDTGFDVTSVTLAENMRKLAAQPLLFQPGERWNYGLSVDVLGRIVEVASGQTLEQFFQDRILRPLKMHDTYFYVPANKLNRLTVLYSPSSAGLSAMPSRLRGSQTYFSGGAGLIATASDYIRFLQMLLNGGTLDGVRLLKPATVRMMTVCHTEDLPIIKFCLGFARGSHAAQGAQDRPSYYYYWSGLFGTQFFWDPQNDLAGVAMVQLLPSSPVGDHLSSALRAAAYEALVSEH